MLKMQYTASREVYDVSFSRITPHVVQLLGDFPIKNEGFLLSREGKEDGWDYRAYTTLYREVEGGAWFSNDGSVYVPPAPLPEPEEPTLEEVKARKTAEIEMLGTQAAGNGVTYEGNVFPYDAVSRAEIGKKLEQAVQTGLPVTVQGIRMEKEAVRGLYIALEKNETHHLSYAAQLKAYTEALTDKESVEAVAYGQELTGDYLSAYERETQKENAVTEAYAAQLCYANEEEVKELRQDMESLNTVLSGRTGGDAE